MVEAVMGALKGDPDGRPEGPLSGTMAPKKVLPPPYMTPPMAVTWTGPVTWKRVPRNCCPENSVTIASP